MKNKRYIIKQGVEIIDQADSIAGIGRILGVSRQWAHRELQENISWVEVKKIRYEILDRLACEWNENQINN